MQIRKKTVDVWMGFEVAKRKEECNYTIFTKNKKNRKKIIFFQNSTSITIQVAHTNTMTVFSSSLAPIWLFADVGAKPQFYSKSQ